MAHVTEDLFRNIECLLSYKLRGKKRNIKNAFLVSKKPKVKLKRYNLLASSLNNKNSRCINSYKKGKKYIIF